MHNSNHRDKVEINVSSGNYSPVVSGVAGHYSTLYNWAADWVQGAAAVRFGKNDINFLPRAAK